MKFIYLIPFIVLSVYCSSGKQSHATNEAPPTTIPFEETKTIVTTLASDEMNGRYTGSPGFDKAADFVIDYFEKNNLQPFYDSYKQNYMADGVPAYNIIATNQDYNPDARTIIISGHLDHLKARTSGDDKIMNGANDNASGVTAAMQIGAYLNSLKTIDENVIIALYSGEEMGLLGSKHVARQMKNEAYDLDLIFNFEMIGTSLTNAPNTVYLTGYEMSNMATAINTVLDREMVIYSKKAKKYRLFSRSDNYPFYNVFKIPAQTFSSYDFTNYDFYHHHDDEADQLDIENMNAIINSLAKGIEGVLINDITIQLKN